MNSFGIDLGINIQKPNTNVIEESHNKDQYYRVVYRVNGKSLGIYEAAKMNMSYDEWKEFKARKEVTWLPVPEGEYGDNNRSYFTKEGWVIFKKKTLPLLEKYLKGGHIETSVTDEIPGTIVYKDRYQIVVKSDNIVSIGEAVNNNEIEALNKEMRSWDYGYICNGKRLTGNKIPEHFKGYKLMGPKTIEKEKIGTCWDYTAYEDYWFNEHNIPHQCWYFQCNRGDNHSWLSYKDGNKVIAFEASWKSYAGLRKYNSEEEMVKDYVGRSMSDWKGEANEEKPGNYFVVKFNQFDIDGMDPEDYMYKCAMYGTFFKGDKKVLSQWKDNREPLQEGSEGSFIDNIIGHKVKKSEHIAKRKKAYNDFKAILKKYMKSKETPDTKKIIEEDKKEFFSDINCKYASILLIEKTNLKDFDAFKRAANEFAEKYEEYRSYLVPSYKNIFKAKFIGVSFGLMDNTLIRSVEEGATMIIKGKVPSCKDFKDFCSKIKTPGDALKWFIKNKVQWPKGDANKYPFHWPDDLVKEKIGNCFDQTVFMHYFCRKKRIDHKMFIISWVGDNGYSTGHAVPMYEKNGYVWIWLYLYPGYGMVGGPFRDYDEAKKTLDQYFLVSVNKALKSPTTPYSSFLDDADVSKFDDYYGSHDITQEDYIMMNHGYNLKSTHMFRFNVGGRSFYNPFGDLLRTIDVLKELYRLFKSQDKVEECYLLEDDSYQTID